MAPQNSGNSAFISPPPKVSVVEGPKNVVALACAAARTCYSEGLVWPEDVDPDSPGMVNLAKSTYQAGHHTLWEHATFTFALEGVSRQLLWSLLHSFPYYNASEMSQRYVPISPEAVVVPYLEGESLGLYQETINLMMEGYKGLTGLLQPLVEEEYAKRFPRTKKGFELEATRKAQEVARYVLPLATKANLYYTINILTLMRLWRLCKQPDAPTEAWLVVGKMIQAVLNLNPSLKSILEDPLASEEIYEQEWFFGMQLSDPSIHQSFVREFDAALAGLPSRLVDWKQGNEALLALAVRSVLGVPSIVMSDEQAITLLLDPAQNPYLSETLNLTTLAKLPRAMGHASWTFQKRLSHTADSQDKRHRTTPASRPLLWAFLGEEPDYIVPELIKQSERALKFDRELMERVWEAINILRKRGVPAELVAYLLPNGVTIRHIESADLSALRHKARMRLCLNAQEEIWRLTVAEVHQVDRINPLIGQYLLAPCQIRKRAGVTPPCPEGSRYCGVPVWEVTGHDYPPRVI